jgi:hypothetical protein
VKAIALAMVLAACGGHDDDACTKLVDHLAQITQARADQRDVAIQACRAHPPPAHQLDCAMAATTADQVQACAKVKR